MAETYQFYNSLDLPLEKRQDQLEDGSEGPLHYTCDLSGIHFAIYALDPWTGPERRSKSHDTMVGFTVEKLENTLKRLSELNVKVIIAPETIDQGLRAVVLDPDGRPVELHERTKQS